MIQFIHIEISAVRLTILIRLVYTQTKCIMEEWILYRRLCFGRWWGGVTAYNGIVFRFAFRWLIVVMVSRIGSIQESTTTTVAGKIQLDNNVRWGVGQWRWKWMWGEWEGFTMTTKTKPIEEHKQPPTGLRNVFVLLRFGCLPNSEQWTGWIE